MSTCCLQCGQELGPQATNATPPVDAGTAGADTSPPPPRRCPECNAVEPDPAWPLLVDESTGSLTAQPTTRLGWVWLFLCFLGGVTVIVLAGPTVPTVLLAALLGMPLALAVHRRRARLRQGTAAPDAPVTPPPVRWLLTPAGVVRCRGSQSLATPWPSIETAVHSVGGRTRLILRGDASSPGQTYTIWLSADRFPASYLETKIASLRATPRSSIVDRLFSGPRAQRPRVVSLCRRCRGACEARETTSPCLSCGHVIEQPDAVILSGYRRSRGEILDVCREVGISLAILGVLALVIVGCLLAGDPMRLLGVCAAIPAFLMTRALITYLHRAALGPDVCWILREDEWVATAMHDVSTHRWADTLAFERGPDRHGRCSIRANVRGATRPLVVWLSSPAEADHAVRIARERMPIGRPHARSA